MSNKAIDGGGTAFPTEYYLNRDARGMSLRDWFAGMALQGILAANAQMDETVTDRNVDYVVAREAYASADAMLQERMKNETPPQPQS